MDDFVSATRSYDRWLAAQTSVVRTDLRLKHERMRESPFVLLRGTYYRWVQLWRVVCRPLARAPRVLSIGDLHVENFGTWRDAEGRLVWGVNDVDEVSALPWTNDLVRLVASALLAVEDGHFALSPRDVCDAVLDGYVAGLAREGRPIVLAERYAWLRAIALSDLRDPVRFWDGLLSLPATRASVPHKRLRAALPDPRIRYRVSRRIAGVGSLGRPRFVALAEWQGGLIAREVKARVPSAAAWAGLSADASERPSIRILHRARRAADPCFAVDAGWITRRLAPDCCRIELTDLPKRRDEWKLLRTMGWETANIHLGSAAAGVILRDLRARPGRWLQRAARDMAAATISDWRAWRRA